MRVLEVVFDLILVNVSVTQARSAVQEVVHSMEENPTYSVEFLDKTQGTIQDRGKCRSISSLYLGTYFSMVGAPKGD